MNPASGEGPAPEDLNLTGAHIVGTPAFMSPEQAERPRKIDARADIYSLGCVGFWLLTGTYGRSKAPQSGPRPRGRGLPSRSTATLFGPYSIATRCCRLW